jgi:hypothetical protein
MKFELHFYVLFGSTSRFSELKQADFTYINFTIILEWSDEGAWQAARVIEIRNLYRILGGSPD